MISQFKAKKISRGLFLTLTFCVSFFQLETALAQVPGPVPLVGTGGTVTTQGADRVHTFTAGGTFTPPVGVSNVEVLVVGGGGGGGAPIQFGTAGGGGGGAGGLVYNPAFAVTGGSPVTITVGAGGGPTPSSNGFWTGNNGSNSTFGAITALGGGGGSGNNEQGQPGGSGGGSRGNPGGVATQPGSASGGFGNRGGNFPGSPGGTGASGGGGAGGAGEDLPGNGGQASDGGVGLQYSITGTPTFYAGGGGGGNANNDPLQGAGGLGGGGNGGNDSTPPVPGSPNTGGGGGGGNDAVAGAAGGSGIVIVRYTVPTLTITQQPSINATTTVPFAQQPVIRLLNGAGTGVSGVNVTASIFSGTGTLSGTLTVTTDAAGLATFPDLRIIGSGNHSIRFVAAGASQQLVSNTIDIIASPPTISILQQPSALVTGSVDFPQQPIVELLDGTAAPLSGINITASIASGSGTLTGTLTVVTNGSGQALFPNLRINGSGNHTIRFTAAGFGVTVDSNVVNVVPPTISINTQPSASATSNIVFAQQPAVELLDNSAAPISGINITALITSGTGTLLGTNTVATNGSGLAVFTDLTIDGTGNHTIRFIAAGSGVFVDSNVVNVVPPVITILQQPSEFNGVSTLFTQQPIIELVDGGASPLSGINITASIFSGTGNLVGTVTVATNGSGQAVFTDLEIDAADIFVLRFTAAGSGVTVDSAPINVGVASISILQQPPASAPSAGVFPFQPIVELLFNGSPVSGTTMTATIQTGGGSLGGSTSILTDGSGLATFSNLSITGSGNHTLRFTAPVFGITVDSAIINIILPLVGCPGFDGSSSPVVFVSCTETKIPGPNISQSITIDQPPGVAEGDLLIAAIAIDESHLVDTTSVAWNLVFQGNAGGGGQAASFNVYSRVATASEPATYTFDDIPIGGGAGSTPVQAAKYGWIMHFTGVSGIVDSAGTINTGQTTPAIAPTVTSLSNNNLILLTGGFDDFDIVRTNGANVDPLIATDSNYKTITMEDSHDDGFINNDGESVSGGAAYLIGSSPAIYGPEDFLPFDQGERWVTVSMALEPLPTQFRTSLSSTSTNNCAAPISVTIQATDDSGNPITTYAGTIDITTNTGFGDWELSAGAGTFTQEGINGSGVGDGTASYTFDPADNGVVILTFSSSLAGLHNFDIVDTDHPGIFESGSFDPDLNIAFCPNYEFAISNSGPTDTCTPATVNFRVAQLGGGPTLFGYTGTITISNDIGAGFWAPGSSSGTLVKGTGDGSASYTFDSADLSVVSLGFYSSVADPTVNFDVTDGAFSEGVDNELVITACATLIPSISYLQCFPNSVTGNVTIPSRASNSNRVVLLSMNNEGNPAFPTSATFDTGAIAGPPVAMLPIGSSYLDDGNFDMLTEVWGLLDSALPATGGNYNVAFGGSGGGNDTTVCLITLIDAEQIIPPGLGVQLNTNPVNFTNIDNPPQNQVTTQITTQEDNALVISHVGNGGARQWLTSTLGGAPLWSVTAGGQQTFGGFSALIPTAGLVTITDTAETGGNFNRVGHIGTAFSPAPSVATQFSITHNNVGGTCAVNRVTISALRANGTIDTNYVGTLTITTTPGLGDWSDVTGVNAGVNAVNNGSLNDGTATYVLAPGDGGSVDLGYTLTSSNTVNFNVTDGSINETLFFDNDLFVGDCAFRISNTGNAYTCSDEAITITAVDGGGNTLTSYAGTISLSTSTGLGAWNYSGVGLTDTFGPNDGLASYTFNPGDNGQVTLNLHHASPNGALSINVFDGTYSEDSAFDPDINVLNTCEFQISFVGPGDTCTAEPITINLVDGDGNPGNRFVGQITLNTSNNDGTWTLNTGAGVFSDATANDGQATYNFTAADAGEVILNFATLNGSPVNFNVTGGGFAVDAGADPTLTIVDCGFEISFVGGNNSDVCSLKLVEVRAVDGSGAPFSYVGTINLSTALTTGDGTWSLDTGAGTFNDPSPEDGAASYTYVAGDGGVAVFEFRHPTPGLVNVDIVAGSLTENASADPDLIVDDCSFRFLLSSASINACSFIEATLEVRDSLGNPAADFIGTVNLTTSTSNGNWLTTTNGLGTLTDTNPNDGIASYTFVDGDGASVIFEFSSETVETLNLEAEFNGSEVDPLFDPALEITQCLASISDTQCYTTESEVSAITLPSSSETGGSRMVLMYTNVESQAASTAATINGAAMTLLRTETATNGGTTNVLQVFAILDAALPTGAGAYSAAHDGNAASAMCLVAVEGVKQSFPVQNGANGQLNGTNYPPPGTGNAATDITVNENNSILLSVAANGQGGTTYTSNLGTSEWITGATDAAGADWAGFSDFQATATSITVTQPNNATPNAETHIALALAPFFSGDPIVEGYVPVTLFQTYSGNVNYRATGNTLRSSPNTSNAASCLFFDPPTGPFGDQIVNNTTGTTATLDIPPGSTVVDAYLYWAGSGRDADIDNAVSFGVDGSEVSFTADGIYLIDNPYGFNLEYFAGYKNVTGLITTTPGETYRFKDLTVRITEPGGGIDWQDIQGCSGGWGMVVVYENPLEDLNVINLFDGFQPFRFTSFTLTPRNFRMGSPDGVSIPNGQITHLTFEGDDSLNEPGELFELQNSTSTLTFTPLVNSENFTIANGGVDAQYNDTITYPVYDGNLDFDPTGGDGNGYNIVSTTSYGTDVDTYYIQGAVPGTTQEEILYPFGLSGAEQITTLYGTGQDGVFLVGEFISVNNAPIADLEVFINQSGTFKVGSAGTGIYSYTVTNNGNGTGATPPGPPFNYADGDVILTINLPVGMTAASVTENGWTCVADVPVPDATAFTCHFDIGTDYTSGAVNSQLWAGESLPDVVVTVNLDDESSYPLISNSVSQSARIAHTENYPGTCVVEVPGVQPDPTLCELPPQFDNVNDLNKNIIDVDDLDEKTANNNNVVQQDTNVLGIVTDLRMVKSVVGVLEENQPAQFQLTVTNLGPDITTKTMTITDTLPDGLVPSTAIGTGWACNIASQTVTCTRSAALGVGASSVVNITTVSVVAPAFEGAFVSNTALVQAGTFNFDPVNGNNTSTTNTQVVGAPVASNRKFLISVNELSDLGTGAGELLDFEDGDLVLYDPQTDVATMFLAEADIPGVTNLNNINAVHLLPNGQILMSTDTDGSSIAGVTFNAEDVVLYDPILQTATVVFSGTGIFDNAANIDAIYVKYNDSYNPSDWDLVVSTQDDELIAAVPYDDNDLIQFDLSPATPTATLLVDGASNDVFGADSGDIDAMYIDFEDENIYTLSTDDPGSVTIGISGTQDTYTQDDLVQLNLTTPTVSVATNVFLGDVANGVFLPASGTRKLDAVHVIEDGYYGHFAIISNGSGNTCTPTSITIRRHVGLSHVTDTNYAGSIRLSNDSGAGEWQTDVSANGMLIDSNTSDGEAIYTFDAADNGEVTLFLKNTGPVSLNIDVTNFFNVEDPNEDNDILVSDVITSVSYLDTFSSVSYNNNDGIASFADNWVEINDGVTNPASGAIKIVSNKLNLTNPGGNTFPEILREIDFSGYTPNTGTDPLTLNFDWSRTGGVGVDSFQVQARNNSSGGAWTTLTTINGLTGAVAGNSVSLDMTAAGITPTATVQIKFVVNAGYQIQSFNLDNIELTTATNDCNVGGTVDHYAISNTGFGISCLVENITIAPHTTADLITQPGPGVTITLNTGTMKGTWFPPVGGAGVFNSTPGNGFAQYTYAAGEDVLVFPFNYTNPTTDPEAVSFSLLDSNIPSKTQLENQTLSVSRAGLRFYNDTAGNMTYPTLVAGMNSFLYTNQILTVQAIQASNDNPAVCEDIFAAGTDVQIELAFECADPAVCSAATIPVEVTNNSNTTVIEPTDNNAGAGPNPGGYDPITLRFETFNNGDFDQDPGAGTDFSYTGARIDLNYADAGSLQIHGRYNIPFLDGAGAQSGNYMEGSGDNNFVVRPFGYDIDVIVDTGSGPQADRRLGGGNDTDAYSWADDADDNGTFVAGEGFNTIVTAIAWDPLDDDGLVNGLPVGVANDGIPDAGSDLFDNDPTPNYGNEADPVQNNMTIVQSLNAVMPVGAVTGTLTNTAYTDFNANNGSQTNALVWDEVGIIDLTATLDSGSYLGSGEGVTGDLFNLGRFIPANFTVTMTNLIDRPLFTPSAANFTYMGEDFTGEFTLTAINALGSPTTTQNYIGDFAKLDTPGELSFFAIEDLTGAGDDIDYTVRLQTSSTNAFPADFSADWVAGVVPLSGNLIFNRQDAPSQVDYDLGLRQEEAPITSLQIAVTAIDEDSVIDTGRNVDDDDGSVETDTFLYNLIGIQEFRYGRIRLENAYGSEIPEEQESDGQDQNITGEDIPIYIIAEYFDGTDFVVNTDDIATPYSSANLSLVPGSFTDNLNATNASSTITVGNGVIFQGVTEEQNVNNRPLFLQAPGEGNDGTMLIELDLDALGLGFLQHEWRGVGEIEDDLQDSSFDDNPRALIEFGVLQSDERIINWQELFLE